MSWDTKYPGVFGQAREIVKEAMDREILEGDKEQETQDNVYSICVFQVGSNLNKIVYTLFTFKNKFHYFSWPRFKLHPLLPRLFLHQMLHY